MRARFYPPPWVSPPLPMFSPDMKTAIQAHDLAQAARARTRVERVPAEDPLPFDLAGAIDQHRRKRAERTR